MVAKRVCEWNKFKQQMKNKRTKKQPAAKVAPGMASILERGELTMQQLSAAAVSCKAQKYERVGASSFLSTSKNLPLRISKEACTNHFKL